MGQLDKYMTTITLNLPEETMKQARQAAAALKRPVEEVLSDMLSAVLPSIEDAPQNMQSELAEMTWMDSQALWQIARSHMPESRQKDMQTLAELQGTQILSNKEQEQLDQLRQEYGRITLRKARAYALLSLRGGKPLLN